MRRADYDPLGDRFYQEKTTNGTPKLRTYYYGGGAYEENWDFETGEIKRKSYVSGLMLHISTQQGLAGFATVKLNYLHTDVLGSTEVITDALGNEVERMAFGPFGQRRKGSWDEVDYSYHGLLATIGFDLTTRGFTGHEHLDDFDLIHMNGRIFDPVIGRFLSPDLLVQAPDFSQSYNRYSYVWNNPLGMVDPSGWYGSGEVRIDMTPDYVSISMQTSIINNIAQTAGAGIYTSNPGANYWSGGSSNISSTTSMKVTTGSSSPSSTSSSKSKSSSSSSKSSSSKSKTNTSTSKPSTPAPKPSTPAAKPSTPAPKPSAPPLSGGVSQGGVANTSPGGAVGAPAIPLAMQSGEVSFLGNGDGFWRAYTDRLGMLVYNIADSIEAKILIGPKFDAGVSIFGFINPKFTIGFFSFHGGISAAGNGTLAVKSPIPGNAFYSEATLTLGKYQLGAARGSDLYGTRGGIPFHKVQQGFIFTNTVKFASSDIGKVGAHLQIGFGAKAEIDIGRILSSIKQATSR